MLNKIKNWCKNAVGVLVGNFIIASPVLIFLTVGAVSEEKPQPQKKVQVDTERRIQAAKEELEKIIKENGKLSWLLLTRPEAVLPPVLALLEDELSSYGIDKKELLEEIRQNPDRFRVAVPEHWRKRFLILTPAHEKLIGDKFDAEFAAKGKIYRNDSEMKRVRRIAERIVEQLPEPAPIRLFLLRDDTVNAFCLPNGSIYVHSGLLKNVKDDDELAFVIAHEYAHFAARHGNEGTTKTIFFMAGDILVADAAGKLEKEGKFGRGLLLRGSYLGGGFVGALLPLSRLWENEADTLGFRYMSRAGYDPKGALRFMQRLASINPDSPLWQKLLSTHPASPKRLERMQAEYAALKNGNSGRKWFKRSPKQQAPAAEEEKKR